MAKEDKTAAVEESFTLPVVKAMIAEAIAGLLTAEQVQALITESLKGVATITDVQDQITASQTAVMDYVNAIGGAAFTELSAINSDGSPVLPPLDPAWLEGLTFSSATQEKKLVEGRPRMVATPIERELLPEDVLGYRVTDDQVFIVTADGKKHTVDI